MDGGHEVPELPGFARQFEPGGAGGAEHGQEAGPAAPAVVPAVPAVPARSTVPMGPAVPSGPTALPVTDDWMSPPRRGARRWRRPALVAGAAVLVVGAGAVIAIVGGGNGDTASSHAVLTAAQSSLADRSADVSLAMTMDVADHGKKMTMTASGMGTVDFTTGDSDVTVTYQGVSGLAGTQLHEIVTDGQLYLQFAGPDFSQLGLGDQWIAAPAGSSSSTEDGGLSQTDPSGMLQSLAAQGDTVTPTGSSTVDGQAVDTYHVTIDTAAAQQRISAATLPASEAAAARQFLRGSDIQLDVAVAPATSTVRQVRVDLDASLGGVDMTGSVVEDFTDYGAPVSITAPPPDQVIPFQQFEQDARAAAGQTS